MFRKIVKYQKSVLARPGNVEFTISWAAFGLIESSISNLQKT